MYGVYMWALPHLCELLRILSDTYDELKL